MTTGDTWMPVRMSGRRRYSARLPLRLAAAAVVLCALLGGLVMTALAATALLPAAGRIAYVTAPTRARAGYLYLLDVDRGFIRPLFSLRPSVTYIAFAPNARELVFVTKWEDAESRIYRAGLNGRRPVMLSTITHRDQYPVWSPDGARLAYLSSQREGFWNLYVMEASGSGVRPLSDLPVSAEPPAWSPDGARIAVVSGGSIVVLDSQTGEVRLQTDPVAGVDDPPAPVGRAVDTGTGDVLGPSLRFGSYSDLAWSPDGQMLAFIALRGKSAAVYAMQTDGTGVRRLTPDTIDVRSFVWSPEGARLALMATVGDQADIFVQDAACAVTLDGRQPLPAAACANPLRQLTDDAAFDWLPAWSPDGRWILFVSYRERVGKLFMTDDHGRVVQRLSQQALAEFQPAWLR